jgi:hypothetical protein
VSVLTPAEVADLWALHDEALTDHVDWWPAVRVPGASKAMGDSWPSKSATFACAVLDREAVIVGDAFIETPAAMLSHTVVLSRSATAPKPADRLFWAERSLWLEVLPSQRPGTYGPARRVECIEIKP